MTAPLCRFCGKPIAKRTERRWFTTDPASMIFGRETKILVEKLPATKEEAQCYFNAAEVVSIQRAHRWNEDEVQVDAGIASVTIWDRSSYVDQFFCTGEHAQRFGYVCAREGRCTSSYNKATKAREAENAEN